MRPWPQGALRQVLATFTLYLLAALSVLALHVPDRTGAAIWPASGVALAALLLSPGRRWPALLATVAVADTLSLAAVGVPLVHLATRVLTDVAHPLVAALLLRQLGSHGARLTPLRPMMVFLLAGVGAAAVLVGLPSAVLWQPMASVGLTGVGLTDMVPRRVLAYALGVLLVTPALLSLRSVPPRRDPLELAGWVVAQVLTLLVVFVAAPRDWSPTLPYLLLPLYTWGALRMGIRRTALALVAAAVVADLSTLADLGPFAVAGADRETSRTLLQLFLLICGGTTMVASALAAELTDRQGVETALRQQAGTDALTGLPNRSELTGLLTSVLDSAGTGGTGVGVVVCDVDGLQTVNDQHGYHAGDRLLTTLADRLRDGTGPGNAVGRIDGDEFVVVVTQAGRRQLREAVEEIRRRVAEPVPLGDVVHTPSVSVGVALAETETTASGLLISGELALAEARSRGRGLVVHFDDRLRAAYDVRLRTAAELPNALADDEVRAVFQPEVELATGEVFGFEALARWQHPRRGAVPPSEFVPVAEHAGLAGRLFDVMLENALRVQRQWPQRAGRRPAVSVNVSALQLDDPRLVESVAAGLERHGVPADDLWLEVTESALARVDSLRTLWQLKELGVHLAIDDFGTGWSSMSRLSAFPWDLLKLDRSFISPLGVDPSAEHVARAVVAMAQALGLRTVAEGVETPLQLDVVTALGFDIVQGYLFCRPVEAERTHDLAAVDGSASGPAWPLPVAAD